MYINPKIAIQEGWITGIVNEEKQVQPNAIDFTVDKAFTINETDFYLTEDFKGMRGSSELEPRLFGYDDPDSPQDTRLNGWRILGEGMLDCLSNMYVNIPEGVAAVLVPRSTLVRNGLFTQNGLYDSGFQGHIGTVIHNRSKWPAYLGVGTRIGQIIFVEAGTASMYSGSYNHDKGTDLDYQE
jgi:deoxycytidine triphosphate deaminase